MRDFAVISDALLEWYDANARSMPWRVPPADSLRGQRQDPYKTWLSEVMLQQTTVAAVGSYYRAFLDLWPDVHALAVADDADVMAAWAGLGYYARARNLLKCARVVSQDYNGGFPDTEVELLTLPGVGPYTAAAIAAIAFDRPAVVVDGNVERVVARLFDIQEPLPDVKPLLREHAAKLTPPSRAGDYAQAVMDLGATICGRTPKCLDCPLTEYCVGYQHETAATLPRRAPKVEKPVRRGIAYFVIREDGAVLLETRPDKGLLGGMLGVPSSDWSVGEPTPAAPLSAEWRELSGNVTHVFTHFRLEVVVHTATVNVGTNPMRGEFVPLANFNPTDLPTAFRKIFRHGMTGLGLQ